MSALFAALRALPFTFALYVLEGVLALCCTAPLALELGGDARASLASAAGRAVWLDRGLELLPSVRMAGRTSGLVLVLWLLAAPALQMGWLAALSRPLGSWRALELGSRLYLRALSVSLLTLATSALLLTPWAGAAWACHALLQAPARARLHDTLLAALLLPGLLTLAYAHVAHDLARARSLSDGAFRALALGLRSAARGRVLLAALGLFAFSLTLRAMHLYALRDEPRLGPWGSVVLLQSTCLAALFVRSIWLAICLACAQPDHESGDSA